MLNIKKSKKGKVELFGKPGFLDKYAMRILMLSWEYPPKSVGGISTHIYYLSHEINNLGHEVHVITCQEGSALAAENDNGVYIHRVMPYSIHIDDFIKWIMHLNYAMIEEGIKLIGLSGKFDIIHAHDWLCAYSAKVLKCAYNIPMICTIHGTEYGRNGGIRTEMQRYISGVEDMLCYEASKIVTCSNYMRQEVYGTFNLAWEKIWVIPNGVDSKSLEFSFDNVSFRRQYAYDNEKIVLYVGRHVFEKGIQVLAEAAKEIINRNENVKFVIAGVGPMTEEIRERVHNYGIENKFAFTGYVDSDIKNKLYRIADAAIVPSLYEPFGIVALEAMAAGCPVVVSDVGGLGEIIEHRKTGLKADVGSANSLASNITELLCNREMANNLKKNALKIIKEKFTWSKVAALTIDMYNMVKTEDKNKNLL